MTSAQALETLLGGTGVTFRMTGPTTASLVALPAAEEGAIMLAPLSILASTGGSAAGRTVITQRDLDRRNPSDLRGVFAGEPGIKVGSSVPMSQKVYVQGMEETNLAVTIDGGRQNNKIFHHNATTLVDPTLLKAKAGYSHSWAGVPLAENYIMNTAWAYGAGPKPVTSDNLTFGLEARHGGVTAEGRVFQTRIDDARAPRFAAGSGILARDVKSRGYEIGIGYAWASGAVRAKYADIDVTIDGRPADSDLGTYLATPMGRIFTLGGAHTFRDTGLTLGADLEVVLDNDEVSAHQRPLEGYEVVNVFAEYPLPASADLTLRLDVHNLFNATYTDRATYGQEFGTVTPLYQPGRSFLISASARF